MAYWDQAKECMSRDEISQLQLERLQATLNRVFKNVSHYRKLFKERDFIPYDLTSLDQLKDLPFTTRSDLYKNYPYGMFAVPLREVVRLHAPSLSLGKPVVMGFTDKDLKNWAELMARNLFAVGVTQDDVVQVSLNFGLMTGPFGVQLGAERIGASVVPMSVGKMAAQVSIMRDFRTTVLVSTATFALNLIRTMMEMRVDPNSLALKYGIFGAEPWLESTRKELEERLPIVHALDTYGITELYAPGVAWECPYKNGLHISEDHFIAEIIDPDTLAVLPENEIGELVITTITKEAFPLIRFRTGDLTSITKTPCSCGRTHARIKRINKRCDHMIVMRGTSFSPDQIGAVLENAAGTKLNFQLVVEMKGDRDYLTVYVEISPLVFSDKMREMRSFVDLMHKEVSEYLGWEVPVVLTDAGSFDPLETVLDKRRFT